MGRFFRRFYGDEEPVYCCAACGAHLAQYKDLLSTNFRGRTGNALLFNQVINVTAGPLEDSIMTTGLHVIRCLFCVICQERVGWKYEVAFEEDQKYKAAVLHFAWRFLAAVFFLECSSSSLSAAAAEVFPVLDHVHFRAAVRPFVFIQHAQHVNSNVFTLFSRPRSLQLVDRPQALPTLVAETEPAAPLHGQVKLDAALTPPTASPPQICAQARSCFQSQRNAAKSAKAHWCVWWAAVLDSLANCSELYRQFRHTEHWEQIVAQSLAHVGPSTLDLYSRGVILLQQWMSLLSVSWIQLDRSVLVTIMMRVRTAARHDAQINRIQPKSFLQSLSTLLASEIMSSFLKGSGDVGQRKEALPLPFAVLVAWERAITQDLVSNWTKLLLGGFLLAIWASLRFGDLQRCDVDSLNLANAILRGSCFQTKVTKQGQPFAVILAGFTASSSTTSWVAFWLRQLQTASRAAAPFKPDFVIPALNSASEPVFETPLSYVAALRALRWAVQTPWVSPMLSPMEAQQFTLHSLKVTMLAAAAQLRLDERSRRLQGHHKIDSVQLYSRDDTVDSIWLQTEISSRVRSGWRPMRPQARGSQQPTPEPLFHLQHKNFPSDLELPSEPGLQDFQFVPDIPCPPHSEIAMAEVSDSSSETSSSSAASSEVEELLTDDQTRLVTNGPSGCTHAMIPAGILAPAGRTFDIDGSLYMSSCGASIRKSAFVANPEGVKWPCHKTACRKLLDRLL
eukprot:s1980_g5.t1